MIGKYKSPNGLHHGEVRRLNGELKYRLTCCGGDRQWRLFRSADHAFGSGWKLVQELPKESDIEDT